MAVVAKKKIKEVHDFPEEKINGDAPPGSPSCCWLCQHSVHVFIEKSQKVGLEGILTIPFPKMGSVALSFCRKFDKLQSPNIKTNTNVMALQHYYQIEDWLMFSISLELSAGCLQSQVNIAVPFMSGKNNSDKD